MVARCREVEKGMGEETTHTRDDVAVAAWSGCGSVCVEVNEGKW